jgi:hypothetical protein
MSDSGVLDAPGHCADYALAFYLPFHRFDYTWWEINLRRGQKFTMVNPLKISGILGIGPQRVQCFDGRDSER